MPTGRPPKPVEVKRRTGNPGRRPLPEPVTYLPGAQDIPSAPRELGDQGSHLWAEAWRYGAAWLSPALDSGSVEMACRLFDECARYREILTKAPLLQEPITTPSGTVVGTRFVPNPAEKMLRRAEASLRGVLSDLAFTPTARARLGLAEVKKQSLLRELQSGNRADFIEVLADD